MFGKLFAEHGLSLDRLRALVEVGASGSIVRAVGGDPIRQSQYSRQIKELEDFFRIELIERHGKGIRLTASGKELARISRFFLMGLSNFQRGCLAEEQVFRLGASATFLEVFLLPLLGDAANKLGARYSVEKVTDQEIERRLHDLTLDFGVVTKPQISRPLQLKQIRTWRLELWVPKIIASTERQAARGFRQKRWPWVRADEELSGFEHPLLKDYEPQLVCNNFLQARTACSKAALATLLPDFLTPSEPSRFFCVRLPEFRKQTFHYYFAWNPRLLRLNPHATRRRDALVKALAENGSKHPPCFLP